ncbi:MAG: hypothetical protein HZA91_00440 [Verrucomicrobia bacterium]|nr:hypothetical protein [Verrucomicrobiota bacterium]
MRTPLVAAALDVAAESPHRKTTVSIQGQSFLINGRPTCAGRQINGMKIEGLASGIKLGAAEAERAVVALTRELRPHRNLTFQIWNEYSERTLELLKVIKAKDPSRLVTNSPGFSGVLGSDEENRALDYLTPHTSRQKKGRHWEIAPREIAGLLAKFKKPVADDEPARCGTSQFGGPKGPTSPNDHILQIWQVWQLGGYIHHDMFQTGYGSPAVPPSGVPDPEFNPYHRQVLEFIAQSERYWPTSFEEKKAR